MQLLKLKLKNYRNYDFLDISFSKNMNIIYGDNGSGKTNLLEAIFVLGITKSFRTLIEKNIIKEENKFLTIEGIINDSSVIKYNFLLSDEGKTVKINNKKIDKISEYISNINIILFNPNDLRLIKDSPNLRRKMINLELSQLNNNYLKLLTDYNYLLKQRNNYLRLLYVNKRLNQEYLDIITEKLVVLGLKIFDERNKFINKINSYILSSYYKITKLNNLKILYVSDCSSKNIESLLLKYKKNQERDIVLGKTQIGIHHDDIKFVLDNKDLKEYGSEGQQKNAIIALKLSEIEIFKEEKNKTPILLLDDLFSELDNKKINNIIKLLKKRTQVFITVTDLDKVNRKLLSESKIFNVKDGKVKEIKYES